MLGKNWRKPSPWKPGEAMSTHPNILSRDGLLLPAGSAGVADNHTSDAKRCYERVVAAVQKWEDGGIEGGEQTSTQNGTEARDKYR